MAPYDNRLDGSEISLNKDMRKLRKPVIEKMRRDRINCSIEQLRMLLEKDLQKNQLPSKPEKADILEMAVSLLRQQIQRTTKTVTSAKQDFAPLLEVTEFIPLRKETETQMDLKSVSHGCQIASQNVCHSLVPYSQSNGKEPPQCYSAADLWRPW
ncbi:transcription factor HES-5-like [Pelobates fuscus]|uniref:transcription factor HES-5-like n=1 Tax=Pelobates fuscus TaxID=191477 RepID=UPI002FE49DCA